MQFIIEYAQHNLNALGLIAGFLTTFSFAMQVLKIILTKDKKMATTSISIIMYLMLTIGIVGWLIYGLALNQWPIIMWNGITLLLLITVLFYTFRYIQQAFPLFEVVISK